MKHSLIRGVKRRNETRRRLPDWTDRISRRIASHCRKPGEYTIVVVVKRNGERAIKVDGSQKLEVVQRGR